MEGGASETSCLLARASIQLSMPSFICHKLMPGGVLWSIVFLLFIRDLIPDCHPSALLQAYVDVMTYQQVLASGAAQAVHHLISQPSQIWCRGLMLVEVMNRAVLVSDGVPGAEFGLDAVCPGAFSHVEPPVAMAGQVCVLEAHGGPAVIDASNSAVLCRANGRYYNAQVSQCTTAALPMFLAFLSS